MLEFRRELPGIHPLANIEVELIAYDDVDDILFRHSHDSDLVSVVHLTWLGSKELPNHPTVEFSGTFGQFYLWYEELLRAASVR